MTGFEGDTILHKFLNLSTTKNLLTISFNIIFEIYLSIVIFMVLYKTKRVVKYGLFCKTQEYS